MALNPVLVIKVVEGNSVGVRARLKDDYVEHEIVLNSVLAYFWANGFPPVVRFLELFESVIKRTINELMPHKNLNLKYEVKTDAKLEDASEIEINLIAVEADGVGFKIDGKQLILQGFRNAEDSQEETQSFSESFDKTLITPDVVLNKYKELKKKQ